MTSLSQSNPAQRPRVVKPAEGPPESGVGWAPPPPSKGVRVVEERTDGAYVVEVRAPRAANPLSRIYRALSAIDVRLVHTEVRVAEDGFVQKLHLLEPDDSRLSHRRLMSALRALAATPTDVPPPPLMLAWSGEPTA